ncbi:MAG: hypothetical protein E6J85_20595 [Deltaproteobacteria bacterium]|nr:MAG: hypothetical protein E6J85_20595 [Deltaproteobacteria bacterium]
MSRSRRLFLAGAATALACQKGKADPAETAAAFAEAVVAGSRRRFPNPLLTTHYGRRVRLYDDFVRGRFVLLNFAYTRCEGKCPRGLSTLLAMRKLLAPRMGCEPDLVTLTLDPEQGRPPAGRASPARAAIWKRSAASSASPIPIPGSMPTARSTDRSWRWAMTCAGGGRSRPRRPGRSRSRSWRCEPPGWACRFPERPRARAGRAAPEPGGVRAHSR